MKKKLLLLLTLSLLSTSMLIGCGETTKQEDTTVSVESSAHESTETSHEHSYVETITIPPTCETDGEATYTCECGDSYTETIKATGHVFENYVSNGDATYTADGTETSKCSNCDVTDTRTAEGSMLTYTYTDMDATMYAQQTVNVRSMPSTDGEKLGSLSTNDEVKVTGQCTETSWYRIEFDGNAAYVSNSYLGADKVAVQASAPATSSNIPTFATYAEVKEYAISLGYPIGTAVDNGDGTCTTYSISHITPDGYLSFDGEYITMDADRTAARSQAGTILGFNRDIHNVDFGNYRNVTIANGENGYTWEVVREQFWIVAK